jgi:hypothetical protein
MVNNLYIYLARLDKKGIKVITAFEYAKKVYPTRITNLDSLGMNQQTYANISKEAYDNRMQYELYAESAESFEKLKLSLKTRGYSHLPLNQFTGYTNSTSINNKSLITTDSTMLRRNSDIRR